MGAGLVEQRARGLESLNQERRALRNRSMQRTVQSRLRVSANVKRTVGAGVEGAAVSRALDTRRAYYPTLHT